MKQERIPYSPPPVHPVPGGEHRPEWSVMIPIYNNAEFIEETLKSVLVQDLGPDRMQIEVVDDCSTDADIEKMVREIGKGRISYYRQPQNVGSVRNFETCLNRSRGKLIHLLHADDWVRDGFYKKLNELFEKHPEVGAAYTNYTTIDHNGKVLYDNHPQSDKDGVLDNFFYRVSVSNSIQYCCVAIKREVYEKLGSYFGVIYGEDWEMWTRIAKQYKFAYTPELLAVYRIHGNNISSNSFRTGNNMRDIAKVIDTFSSYHEPAMQKEIRKTARKNYSIYSFGMTAYIWHVSRHRATVFRQVYGALKLYTNAEILMKAGKMYAKVILHPVRKLIGNVKH